MPFQPPSKLSFSPLKGEKLTLAETLKLACTFETVESQFHEMKLEESNPAQAVNQVRPRRRGYAPSLKRGACYRCGYTGHYRRDPNCPARGKKCESPDGKGHSRGNSTQRKDAKRKLPGRGKGRTFHHVAEDNIGDESYAFSVRKTGSVDTVPITIGGVTVDMLIDSGCFKNIIDKSLWVKLKKGKIKCTSKKSSAELFAYGQKKKTLKTIGSFFADTTIEGRKAIKAQFVVIEEKGIPLLGRTTVEELGVLKVGQKAMRVEVNTVTDIQGQYPGLFKGLGKLKDRQLKLTINHQVKPVAQPVRRIPFSLRGKVEKKVRDVLDKDVIEPVEGATGWVSPIVVAPKHDGDIRFKP